jgi:hypothetical protein
MALQSLCSQHKISVVLSRGHGSETGIISRKEQAGRKTVFAQITNTDASRWIKDP